jgi:integrase
MSKIDSTAPTSSRKPAKPSPEFPLFAHAAGVWAKKIRGKLHYFGSWSDPDAALAKYLEQKDALHAGRKPREDAGETTVKDAVNAFLNERKARVNSGQITSRTWEEYKMVGDLLVTHLGKSRVVADLDPSDFASLRTKLAKKWGPHRLAKTIQYVRSIFKHALEARLLDRPLCFGPGFDRPSKKVLRLHRSKQGTKLFTAEEIRRMIAEDDAQLRAMVLLGANCGFGNADCGNLPLAALDLDGGWVNYPRPKTGIHRRCPLWPETVDALRKVLAKRKEPKDEADAGLVFITKYGQCWAKTDSSTNPISQATAKLMKKLGLEKGRNFYCLRHVFRTVADEAKDQPACDHIMGHESPHMSSVYRERISDDRLKAVADHVRTWLFAPKKENVEK